MDAILSADYIVLGPGDLYTSILANLVVKGVKNTIIKSNAKIMYVTNLVTKYGQTYDFSAKDHVEEIAKYLDRYPDYVFVNKEELPQRILKEYKKEEDFPVVDDLTNDDYEVVRASMLVPKMVKKPSGDVVRRSLIRHDPERLAWEIVKVIKEADLSFKL